MKFRGSLFFSAVLLAMFVGAFIYPTVDYSEKETIIMQTLLGGLSQLHYQPQNIDDGFSERVYNLYLDRLDGSRRFFTEQDIAQMIPYKHKIDDEASSGTYEFFDLSLQLFNASLKRAEGYYKEILKEPFDFTLNEQIELDGEKKAYAKNEAELKDYWRKILKYEVMLRLTDKMEAQKDEEVQKEMDELEAESRKAVEERYDRFFERLFKDRRTDRLSLYLNSITNVYDPHTGYFEPKDKENFDIGMSGTLEGIGARLQEDGDFTKVASIVPGGPAWKQKQLEVNDKIIKVAQGDEEPVDVTGLRLDDVVKKIRGKKGTKVKLTVKKVDGSVTIIPIVRDVVIIDESFAKSLILDAPDGVGKVGYIRLPRFYADFNRRGGRSCATDVAVELEKLKAANVDGIVLDLRNNGGGSLRDVVRMSGLFIEEGPIVQVKAREGRPEILEDTDAEVQYSGPLVVMVNSYSASASEILAAALQDYGRAVIVGSNSTFGKGTVQRFFDLDRAIRGASEVKPLGEVKLTIQKFYRVNGGSTQLRGVVPDIILPDRYHFLKLGEQEHDFPMGWTEIDPVDYSQSVASLDNLSQIKAASTERVKQSESFQLVLESAKYLKEQRDDTDYPLNVEQFIQLEDQLRERSKKYEKIADADIITGIQNPKEDVEYIEADESRKARNDDWIDEVKKDIYIHEVLHIVKDLVSKQ